MRQRLRRLVCRLLGHRFVAHVAYERHAVATIDVCSRCGRYEVRDRRRRRQYPLPAGLRAKHRRAS